MPRSGCNADAPMKLFSFANACRPPLHVAIGQARRLAVKVIDPSWMRRRETAFALVFIAHALLILVLVDALRPGPIGKAVPEMEVSISPGGLRIERGVRPKLNLKFRAVAVIPPPDIVVADDPPRGAISLPVSAGGPAVTVPAEAIGAFRTVPPLSGEMLAVARRVALRLLLTISSDGTVTKAVIENSSGQGALDSAVAAWVVAHWRYKPAMQDGHAISVSTTAIVPF